MMFFNLFDLKKKHKKNLSAFKLLTLLTQGETLAS